MTFTQLLSSELAVILFQIFVETASCGVHKLIGTGGVPSSLTLIVLAVAGGLSVFTGRSAGTSYS